MCTLILLLKIGQSKNHHRLCFHVRMMKDYTTIIIVFCAIIIGFYFYKLMRRLDLTSNRLKH